MAFKILSSEEIQLLTENQQDTYKKELCAYYDRVKFIELIEKYENAQIKSFEPKFTDIEFVGKLPKTNFVKPEYIYTQIKPITKPIIKTSSVNFDEPIIAVVPRKSTVTNVSTEHIIKFNPQKPNLPNIIKLINPINSFKKLEKKLFILPPKEKTNIPFNAFKKPDYEKINLPNVVKHYTFSKIFVEYINIESTINNNQNKPVKAQFFDINTFSSLNNTLNTSVKLPQMRLNIANMKNYQSIDKTVPVLPKLIMNQKIDVSFKTENKIKAQLPNVSNISPINFLFEKPVLNRVNLPTYSKTKISISDVANNKYKILDVSNDSLTKMRQELHSLYKFRKFNLQQINKLTNEKYLFENTSIYNMTQINYPSINVISVKPFKKVLFMNKKLPKIKSVDITDIYSDQSYKDLLSLSKLKVSREDFS